MTRRSSAKAREESISLIELMERFPDEATAAATLAKWRWGESVRSCPRCGSTETNEIDGVAYWCKGCRRRFSVRTGTILERSKIPLHKWVITIHLCVTNPKGVSSMKLQRDLDITQKTAWFMAHRICAAWTQSGGLFHGPVKLDKTCMSRKRRPDFSLVQTD